MMSWDRKSFLMLLIASCSIVTPNIANALCPYGSIISLSIDVSKSDVICDNQYQQFRFPVTSGNQYEVTITPSSSSYDPDLYVGATSSVSNTGNYFANSTNGGGSEDSVSFTANSSKISSAGQWIKHLLDICNTFGFLDQPESAIWHKCGMHAFSILPRKVIDVLVLL
jgi:hypothetical protein